MAVLLVVRDKSLDIEHYSNITVKTKVPFTNSWLFVHGAAGERKIGCLSWDVAGKAEITPDIQDAMGRPGYPNMTGIPIRQAEPRIISSWNVCSSLPHRTASPISSPSTARRWGITVK